MSKLEKLGVRGVRSFGPNDPAYIRFHTPLTLIVGVNGSGKTTIIECLKYATTGLLPSNSKTGGAFIHDPNLCREKEVVAQVMLEFTSSTGGVLTTVRNLKLTVSKTKRTQKTLEGHLTTKNHGERGAISSRNAELDRIVPQYLGVSTAVIDNVIFCHQEDSLWPLSEPAALKKKFDEIFEAQKYTKVIDNLKGIRKVQMGRLVALREKEDEERKNKDKAERAQKQTKTLEAEIATLEANITDLGRRMDRATERAHRAWKESESYSKLVGELKAKRTTADGKQSILDDLKTHLKEVPESDEWLQSTLDEFESRLEQYQGWKDAKQDEYLERKAQYDTLLSQLGQKQKDQGRHESDKADYERKLEHRKEKVRDTAAKHGLRGYADLTDDALVDEFMFEIQKTEKDQRASLDRARREADSEKRQAQSLVNQFTARQSALQDSKVTAKQQMARNDAQANEYQKKVDSVPYDEGSKAVLESRMEELKGRMRSATDMAAKSDWEVRIQEANTELRTFEDEISRFNHELIQGTRRAGEMARLSHLKQELKERQRSLQTMLNTHTNRLTKLIGNGWNAATVEQHHQAVLDEAKQEASNAEQERTSVVKDMEHVQFKQSTFKNDLSRKLSEMEQCEKKVRAEIDEVPFKYPRILNEMQENLETVRDRASGSKSLITYLNKILETANRQHEPACRVCSRTFRPGDQALPTMKNKLMALVNAEAKSVTEEAIKEMETDYQRVVDAGSSFENWNRLQKFEIPPLEAEIKKLTQEYDVLVAKAEQHDRIVEKRLSAKTELDQVTKTVASIAKYHAEIAAFEVQVEQISSNTQHEGIRVLEDIQQDISNLAEKIRVVKKTIAQQTTDRDLSRTEISGMELRLSSQQNELNNAVNQLEKKASLIARVEEFKTLNERQREALSKLDEDISGLEPEIAVAKAKYEDIAQRAEVEDRELSRKASELAASVNALNLINSQIKEYIDRGGPEQLKTVQREIKQVEQNLKNLETELKETTRDINKLNEQLQDSENTKRRYADNVRYRQESRALRQLRVEIQDLASHNAEVDRDRLEVEGKQQNEEYTRLANLQAGQNGEKRSKDKQLIDLLAQYQTDFHDAAKRYREAHIDLETTKAAVEDLARCAGAVDKAVMKFHSVKMEEINHIIGELWQETYQGTDIDTIMIRSGNENGVGGGAGARSYNYRVVMIKQDAEMDMRGRCSAGQKVLASIIIRLALAECFGVNCGVIALDEPTTNLDEDNIRALAESLHRIIKMREVQSNFQLIVITHDENFLRQMQCQDFTDYYYRVGRNEQCNSVIERQGIANVM